MIQLSNGHQFEYMTASGALGLDGMGYLWERPFRWFSFLNPSLFTVVIKTLTNEPRKGNLQWFNPFNCVRLFSNGVVNAVGLTNPGIEWWCREIGPYVGRAKIPLVGSIFSNDIKELATMVTMLNDFDLVGLEINASCPSIEGDFLKNTEKVVKSCQTAKEKSRFPLILKLSVIHDIETIAPQLKGIIEAISINSVPWAVIFPDRSSPLAHLGGGGISGKIAQPFTWGFVEKIVKATSIPVIGPSVWDFSDIEKLRKLRAKAVSFGSVFLKYPWRPTMFVRKDKRRHRGCDLLSN